MFYNTFVTVAGIVTDLRVRTTRRGEPMAWAHLADGTGSIETVAFPVVYSRIVGGRALKTGSFIGVRGRVAHEPTGTKLFLDDLWPMAGAGAGHRALAVSVERRAGQRDG